MPSVILSLNSNLPNNLPLRKAIRQQTDKSKFTRLTHPHQPGLDQERMERLSRSAWNSVSVPPFKAMA